MAQAHPHKTRQKKTAGPGRPGALALALRLVARRPRTRAEIERRLADAGHASADVAAALTRLDEYGYLDDFALARDFIVARSSRLRHSRQRLLRDLGARGVEPAVAEAAWDAALAAGTVDPRAALRGQVSRHVTRRGGALDVTTYRRVYSALLREGHDREWVDAELEAYLPRVDPNP